MQYVTLSNGVKMPILGYGVYQVTKDECERCVLDALKAGYRSLDTAQSYFNEEEVGSAMKKSGIPREEIFLTSKVWVEHYGYEEARKSVEESLRKLQTDYLDLMLLHQPFNDYYGAYRALEDLYDEGKLRAIGVSNFYPDRLVDLASFTRIPPMVNQIETHVLNQRIEDHAWMEKYHIAHEAWAPFGEGRGGLFDNEVLKQIGEKYGKTAAQAISGQKADLIAVQADTAAVDIVETHQKVDDRGLSGAGRPDDSDDRTGRGMHAEVMDDRHIRQIAESDIVQRDIAADLFRRCRLREICGFLFFIQQSEDSFRGGAGGLQLADDIGDLVDRAAELSGILYKGTDITHAQLAEKVEDRTEGRDQSQGQVIDEVDGRPHNGSIVFCCIVGSGALLVDLIKTVGDHLFPGIGPDRFLPGDHLLDIAVHGAQLLRTGDV